MIFVYSVILLNSITYVNIIILSHIRLALSNTSGYDSFLLPENTIYMVHLNSLNTVKFNLLHDLEEQFK